VLFPSAVRNFWRLRSSCFAAFWLVLEKLSLAFVSLYKNWPPGPINSKMRKDSVTAQRQRMNFGEA
jgi:hypothetical protein